MILEITHAKNLNTMTFTTPIMYSDIVNLALKAKHSMHLKTLF